MWYENMYVVRFNCQHLKNMSVLYFTHIVTYISSCHTWQQTIVLHYTRALVFVCHLFSNYGIVWVPHATSYLTAVKSGSESQRGTVTGCERLANILAVKYNGICWWIVFLLRSRCELLKSCSTGPAMGCVCLLAVICQFRLLSPPVAGACNVIVLPYTSCQYTLHCLVVVGCSGLQLSWYCILTRILLEWKIICCEGYPRADIRQQLFN